jgi:hypothetical protein
MSRGPALFSQADLARALKGAKSAGAQVERAEIDRAGKIVLIFSADAKSDDNNELDQFRREHGYA